VNVHAPYLLSKAALPDMVAQKWGRIIAVGSIAGKLPTPFGVGYSATKAAVNGLSRTIAQEHAKDGITANVICPGPVESRMELARQQFDADNAGISLEQKINSATPMGPHGQPEDVSPLAVYLASDDSSFVTGQAWNVDGGILMAT